MKRIGWVIGIIALVGAYFVDAWAYHHVVYRGVYDHDWGRALRDLGYWPTWAVVTLGFWLHERATESPVKRAWTLIASVSVAGIVAEVMKILVRRERPSMNDGAYAFRSWHERPFSSSGFGFPSSHAVEAFSAATVLSFFFPESRCLWWALATACAVTRVLAGAHFVSDVIAGALIGIAVASWFVKAGGSKTRPYGRTGA